jgi:hypothetical protein
MPEIARIYQDRLEQTGLERRDRFWKELYQFFFSRRIPANASVLELARGYGEFINNIAAGRKFAVDINPDSARHVTPDVTFFNVAATGLPGSTARPDHARYFRDDRLAPVVQRRRRSTETGVA